MCVCVKVKEDKMSEDAGAGQGYVSTELFGGAMEADMPVGFGDVRYVV